MPEILMGTSKQENLKKGLIYLSGGFVKENIDPIIEDILFLNRQDSVDKITLLINSPGGYVADAFTLIDVMEMSKKKITTIGMGYIASCGLLTFMAGNERLISDKAMILSHQFSGGKAGKYHELVGHRKLDDYINDRMLKHYIKHTKLSKKVVKEKLLGSTDVWLYPNEAVKFNLAERVINKF
jgi:ATP-dependent Clp protease protease subunit